MVHADRWNGMLNCGFVSAQASYKNLCVACIVKADHLWWSSSSNSKWGSAEEVLRGSLSAAMPLGVAVRFWLDAAAALQ